MFYFLFCSFFFLFFCQRKVQLSFRNSCSILEAANFANQMNFGKKKRRWMKKTRWTACSRALVNTRRKKRRKNSYENYTNYRYRFDICGYVSQHRRSVQSTVDETVSSFQFFFPPFSTPTVLCWLFLRMRFVFPVNEHTHIHRTQWALIEIVIFDRILRVNFPITVWPFIYFFHNGRCPLQLKEPGDLWGNT